MKSTMIRGGMCCLAAIGLAMSVQAANKPKALTSFEMAIQESLLSEFAESNDSVDRREILRPGTRPDAEPDNAWWQSGYLLSSKQWQTFEASVVAGTYSVLLDDYGVQRSKLSNQPHGQWQLANWCRKNGLHDQERVHLLRVLVKRDPEDKLDSAYERLGCQKFGDQWVSPQERLDTVTQHLEIQDSYQRWNAKLETLIQQLNGTPKQQALAQTQLQQIVHPSAVPAIVNSLCRPSQALAEEGIKVLGEIPGYQSSRALAGQAVFSQWKSVRMRSVELLKLRRLEEFVPDLLLLLSCPVRVHVTPSDDKAAEGSLIKINWDYVWTEETQDTIWVGKGRLMPASLPANTVQMVNYNLKTGRVNPSALNGFYFYDNDFRRHRLSDEDLFLAFRDMAEEAKQIEYSAERASDQRLAMNERVGKILSDCSDQPNSSEPKVWWNWWTTYTNVASPSYKSVVVVVDARPRQRVIPTQITVSCLIAGTPIWTERGLVPIEQIKPGDRVLSKDVHSGELCYKPVLQTTRREPTAVQKIHVGEEQIVSSLGHHFWVSGEGWSKTRELLSKQPLHTVTGMLRISRIDDDGQLEKVYNLVVADFHTYFVGKSMILSHDVTTPRLTNIKVPGLALK